jgi:hypothetical protein
MNTRSSPALAAVIDELNAAGASWEVTRSKHFKVRWTLGYRAELNRVWAQHLPEMETT